MLVRYLQRIAADFVRWAQADAQHTRTSKNPGYEFIRGCPSVFNMRGIADATLKMRPVYTLEHLADRIRSQLRDFVFGFGACNLIFTDTREVQSVENRPVIWISFVSHDEPEFKLPLLYITIDSTTPHGYARAFPGTDVGNVRPVLMRLDGDDVQEKMAPLLDRADVNETLATFALHRRGLSLYHVAHGSAELEIR